MFRKTTSVSHTAPANWDGLRGTYRSHAQQLLATTHWNLDRLGPLDTAYGIEDTDKDAVLSEFTAAPLDLVEACQRVLDSLLRGAGPVLPSQFGSSAHPAPEAYPAYVAEMQGALAAFEAWVGRLPAGHVTLQVQRPSSISSNRARWRATVQRLDGEVVCGPLELPVGSREVAPALALPLSPDQDRLLLHLQVQPLPDTEAAEAGGLGMGMGPDWCWAVRLELAELAAGLPVRPSLDGDGLPLFVSSLHADPASVPIFHPRGEIIEPPIIQSINPDVDDFVDVLLQLHWHRPSRPDPSARPSRGPLGRTGPPSTPLHPEADFTSLLELVYFSMQHDKKFLKPDPLPDPPLSAEGSGERLQGQGGGGPGGRLQRVGALRGGSRGAPQAPVALPGDGDAEYGALLREYSGGLAACIVELQAVGAFPRGVLFHTLVNNAILGGIRPLTFAIALLLELLAKPLPTQLPAGYLAGLLRLYQWAQARQDAGPGGPVGTRGLHGGADRRGGGGAWLSRVEREGWGKVQAALMGMCLRLVFEERGGEPVTHYVRLADQDAEGRLMLGQLIGGWLRQTGGWGRSAGQRWPEGLLRRAAEAWEGQAGARPDPVKIRAALTQQDHKAMQACALQVQKAWQELEVACLADSQLGEGIAAGGGDAVAERYRAERVEWMRARYKRAVASVRALLGPELNAWPYRVYAEAGGLEGLQASVEAVNKLLLEAGMAKGTEGSSSEERALEVEMLREVVGEVMGDTLPQFSSLSATQMVGPPTRRVPSGTLGPRHYKIKIKTSSVPNAGTAANVYLRFTGHRVGSQLSCSGTRFLPRTAGAARAFAPGEERTVVLEMPHLGQLAQVVVGHDTTGVDPKWRLEHLEVTDTVTKEVWYFICNDWIGVHAPECTLLPSNSNPASLDVNYTIKLQTGVEKSSGTKELIYVDIKGHAISSGPRLVTLPHHDKRVLRASLVTCEVTARDVGQITSVDIWHENRHEDEWRLETLWITDPTSSMQAVCPAHRVVSGVTPLKALPEAEVTEYRIEMKTADEAGAGTKDTVLLQMWDGEVKDGTVVRGDMATGPLALVHEDASEAQTRTFGRGQLDTFVVKHRRLKGVRVLEVWLDKLQKGSMQQKLKDGLKVKRDDWKLEWVEVTDLAAGLCYRFTHGGWVGRSEDASVLLCAGEPIPKAAAPQKLYNVIVQTAFASGAGTKARPFVELRGKPRGAPGGGAAPGELRSSGRKVLRLQGKGAVCGRGDLDRFQIKCDDLGDIHSIVIGHNNKAPLGMPDDWAVQSVRIEDAEESRAWVARVQPCPIWINRDPYEVAIPCELASAESSRGGPQNLDAASAATTIPLLDWRHLLFGHLQKEVKTIGRTTPDSLTRLLQRYPLNKFWDRRNRTAPADGPPGKMLPYLAPLVEQGVGQTNALITCVQQLVANLQQHSVSSLVRPLARHLVSSCVAYTVRMLLHHTAEACLAVVEYGPPHPRLEGQQLRVANPLLSGSTDEDVGVVDWWVELGVRLNSLLMLDASLRNLLSQGGQAGAGGGSGSDGGGKGGALGRTESGVVDGMELETTWSGSTSGYGSFRGLEGGMGRMSLGRTGQGWGGRGEAVVGEEEEEEEEGEDAEQMVWRLVQSEALAVVEGYVERVEAALRRRLEAGWGGLLASFLRLQHEEDLLEFAPQHLQGLLHGVAGEESVFLPRFRGRVLELLVRAAEAAGKKLLLGLEPGFNNGKEVDNLKRVFSTLQAQLPPPDIRGGGEDWSWLTASHLGDIAQEAQRELPPQMAVDQVQDDHFELQRSGRQAVAIKPFLGDDHFGGYGIATSRCLSLLDRVRLLLSRRQLDGTIPRDLSKWLASSCSQVIFGLPLSGATPSPPYPYEGTLIPYAHPTAHPPAPVVHQRGVLRFYGSFLVATTLFTLPASVPLPPDQTGVWDLQQGQIVHAEPDPRSPEGVLLDLPHGRVLMLRVELHRDAFLQEFHKSSRRA